MAHHSHNGPLIGGDSADQAFEYREQKRDDQYRAKVTRGMIEKQRARLRAVTGALEASPTPERVEQYRQQQQQISAGVDIRDLERQLRQLQDQANISPTPARAREIARLQAHIVQLKKDKKEIEGV